MLVSSTAYGEMFRDKVIENLSQPPDKRNLDQINELYGDNGPFPLTEAALLMNGDDGWELRDAAAERGEQRLPSLPPEPAKSIAIMDNNPLGDIDTYRGNPNARRFVPRQFSNSIHRRQPAHWNEGSGRKQLADGAIANPQNPLTARVMANRVWQQHFGQGIVATPSNFGELARGPRTPNCSTIWPTPVSVRR